MLKETRPYKIKGDKNCNIMQLKRYGQQMFLKEHAVKIWFYLD
jgi:hypothetical protein